MGYRRHTFYHRKGCERKRLGARMLKSNGGRPKKCRNGPEPHGQYQPQNPETQTVTIKNYSDKITLPSDLWIKTSREDVFEVCKLGNHMSPGATLRPVIAITVQVATNGIWSISAHERRIDVNNCAQLSRFPTSISPDCLSEILVELDKFVICPGNPDDHFVDMVQSKLSQKSGLSCWIDSSEAVNVHGSTHGSTVRSTSCPILLQAGKCSFCLAYRTTLRKMHLRCTNTSPQNRVGRTSHVNLRYLTTTERRERHQSLRKRLRAAKQRLERLKTVIESSVKQVGVAVDEELNHDLSAITTKFDSDISQKFAEGSFQRLFWKQQIEAHKLHPTQMRWHPAMIRWCLSLKFQSTATYESLRNSGVISLPSTRTLRDYTHFIRGMTGFDPAVTEQLIQETDLDSLKDFQKYVVLVLDEMKVKERLVFDKHGFHIIGFTDLGTINNEIAAIENSGNVGSGATGVSANDVATHMLVIMVRGLFINLAFPFAQFATREVSGHMLYSIVWEAVQRLEAAGFKVIAVNADGASPNRKFFHIHGSSNSTDSKCCYKTSNPYAMEERDIYFFSDVPHLLKTTRNCWSNSFSHANTRALWINGHHISWTHLTSLYKKCSTEAGLSLLPKLKKEHIYLNSYSRMRVRLACQVLSTSVADALVYFGDPETVETIRFCRMFDKFFDCLNSRCFSEGHVKRKPNRLPYRTPLDTRFEWLKNDFLGYLQEWKKSVKERPGFDTTEQQRMMLSRETQEGLEITTRSFVELGKSLLSKPDVKVLFSERFNQDPLESFFGKQRSHGGYCDNPSVSDFVANTVSLRVQGSLASGPVRGNCTPVSGGTQEIVVETPLPKRRRKH